MPTRSKPLGFLRSPADVNQPLTGLDDGPVSDDTALQDRAMSDRHPNTKDGGVHVASRGHGGLFHQQRGMDCSAVLNHSTVVQEGLRSAKQGGLRLEEVVRLADVKPKPVKHQSGNREACLEH